MVECDSAAATQIDEMLCATWSSEPAVARAARLTDATHGLLEHEPDVVLLGLPLHDGDDFPTIEHWLEQLRTAAPDVPVVLLSDGADDDLALSSIKAGAQDCLPKAGLEPELLRRAVLSAIERKRIEVELAHRALHDPLTGLPNRALFVDRLGVALDRSRRTNGTVAVMFLDVDNFKRVNDRFGHAAGDRLLAGLAGRLQKLLRPMDTVARFGGDEFTLLFEDLATEREVVLIADRVSRAASSPIRVGGRTTTTSVSIGIAMVDNPSVGPDTVIREADAAMYRAKELGRSRYELYDEASRRRAMERLELEAALEHAVERAELEVHYQPNVSLSDGSGTVVGVEALVRWHHPEHGLMAPAEFIPVAEDTGLMSQIGQYVLDRALEQLGSWRAAKPDMTVWVNVSFRQLEDKSLVDRLAEAIRSNHVEPDALCLEVTERALAHNPETAIRSLKALKELGVRLAIDDFGTGLSSLSNLKRLPIDAIKIHESVVRDLGTDPQEGPIVGAVVELGHALGLSVVAEGVETDAQAAELRTLGCDGAQGFLFGRPVPEDEVDELLMPPATARLT